MPKYQVGSLVDPYRPLEYSIYLIYFVIFICVCNAILLLSSILLLIGILLLRPYESMQKKPQIHTRTTMIFKKTFNRSPKIP